jgi:thiol-disulfide isomerase/thioredoxin
MQKNVKRGLALVLLAALVLGLALTSCAPAAPAVEATEAPATEAPATEAPVAATAEPSDEGGMSFTLTTLTGETIDDSIISNNKLTMVNYWATWCGPCVGEIPDLQKINEEYADKGFSIIGVLIGDDDYDGARQFMSDTGVTYPVVLPEGVFMTLASGIQAIPTTMFFDSNGQQVGDTQIGSMSYSDWTSLIDSLLSQVS